MDGETIQEDLIRGWFNIKGKIACKKILEGQAGHLSNYSPEVIFSEAITVNLGFIFGRAEFFCRKNWKNKDKH